MASVGTYAIIAVVGVLLWFFGVSQDALFFVGFGSVLFGFGLTSAIIAAGRQ